MFSVCCKHEGKILEFKPEYFNVADTVVSYLFQMLLDSVYWNKHFFNGLPHHYSIVSKMFGNIRTLLKGNKNTSANIYTLDLKIYKNNKDSCFIQHTGLWVFGIPWMCIMNCLINDHVHNSPGNISRHFMLPISLALIKEDNTGQKIGDYFCL